MAATAEKSTGAGAPGICSQVGGRLCESVAEAIEREAVMQGLSINADQCVKLAGAALDALKEPPDYLVEALIEYTPSPYEISGEDREAYQAMFRQALSVR